MMLECMQVSILLANGRHVVGKYKMLKHRSN